ncbi:MULTISPECIES: DDE-type integrase/transposase/recombinase [Enterobacterales]|uniref:DDE-type integrase/transposase/recombinase n=1 Tax=Enterobacterales TaxID=91347 RepID=UPI00107BB4BB|nr:MULTISPECIES: DDE-type integrase/transposase/recombinase [Enterobacterales]ECD6077978.1 integrase [Salmonella enterica subsp. enterica serovar Cotham]EKN4740816.1 DDE-type integrase/transposase/recombinase [Yersinia enterocolitica]MBD8169472.1 DDE-type integrase/transposase/recombinase [Erwinia persicina]QLP19676.1 DDE-type integrase/transposase/recombinase [Enterobacter hormaechei]
MSAALTERLVSVARAARDAGHGKRGAVYDAACAELGLSRATLLRKLKEVSVTDKRKKRVDAGRSALSREEAALISATLREATRKNGKRLYSIADAVETLRTNGFISAGRTDEETGEFFPLSEDTISRALRNYGLHPEQLDAPAPSSEMASLHPNHVWEIDASLCTLYYLSNGHKGLQVMDSAKFYKNKPANIARIASDRVWSYEITDHTSGWIYVEYVMGAESGENLCSVLINAMQERGGADVLHGVPKILYLDPGSANTAGMTKNMCRSLGINLIAHKPHNARATGQVEKARDIIERKLEPGLKFQPVNSLEELNTLAVKWRSHFNATAVHSRHRKTRTDIWLKITAEQLLKAPSVEVCRELAVAAPESRKVTSKLRVPFRGIEYDVSAVPGVMVGEKLMITRNPWRTDAAQVVLTGEDGHEMFFLVDEVKKNEFGFAEKAAVFGESHKAVADTPAQTAAKEIEQLVTGTENATDAAAARKAKALPFGGRLDPYKHIDDTTLPTYMPRRGQASEVRSPRVEQRPLTHVEAAKVLREKFTASGHKWTPEHYRQLAAQYPDGVPEVALDEVMVTLTTPARSSVISIVNGN